MQWEASVNAMPSVQLDQNVPQRPGVPFMQLLGMEELRHGTAVVICKALKAMERMNRDPRFLFSRSDGRLLWQEADV